MPVNSTHPQYASTLPAWLRSRDVLAGEDAVKSAGIRYLPRLESQTDDEYCAYKQRAAFFNATARTAEGYIGLIFRRPPFLKLPEPATALGRTLADFRNDADMLGTSLFSCAKDIVNEIIAVGRAGTLIDWEGDVENRPFIVLYRAEQILNWRVSRINGRNVPTLIVLHEPGAAKIASDSDNTAADDPFQEKNTDQIRVLKLVPAASLPSPGGEGTGEGGLSGVSHSSVPQLSTIDRVKSAKESAVAPLSPLPPVKSDSGFHCVVELWQKEQTTDRREKEKWKLIETRVPLRLGKPLPLLPFVFHGPRHSQPGIEKLPLADLIAVNLDHYRLDADYKHGVHFTALPTAWVSGFDKKSDLRIGSSTAWITDTIGATAGFLEFTGQGLTTFERAMDRDEKLMAILGSRLLESQKKVGEAAQAIELRQAGENSILGNLAISLGASLTHVLRWIYWWNSTEQFPDDITDQQVLLELNTDFSLKGLSSDEITAIVSAWQAKAISRNTMSELFRRGEVLPEGRTEDEETRLINSDPPTNPAPSGRGSSPDHLASSDTPTG